MLVLVQVFGNAFPIPKDMENKNQDARTAIAGLPVASQNVKNWGLKFTFFAQVPQYFRQFGTKSRETNANSSYHTLVGIHREVDRLPSQHENWMIAWSWRNPHNQYTHWHIDSFPVTTFTGVNHPITKSGISRRSSRADLPKIQTPKASQQENQHS